MPMTQKDARIYVDPESESWEMIEQTEHLMVYRLRFKSLTFYRIDVIREMPVIVPGQYGMTYRNQPERGVMYYIGEANGHLGEPCGITTITRAVYAEDHRDPR